jgi:hypothetical protein
LCAPRRDIRSFSRRDHLLGHHFNVIHEVIGEIDGGRHEGGELEIVIDDEADVMGAGLQMNGCREGSGLFARTTNASCQSFVGSMVLIGVEALLCFSQGRGCYTMARQEGTPIGWGTGDRR